MIKDTIKKYFKQFAYQAVCFAEQQIGSGFGDEKKEMAIEFLLKKLPAFIKPFTPLLKPLLMQILDEVIEQAVDLLHALQEKQRERKDNG